jgi:hypothetical protein
MPYLGRRLMSTWYLGLKGESRLETATYMSLDWDFNRCPLDARLLSRTGLLPSWVSYTDRYDEALIQLSN